MRLTNLALFLGLTVGAFVGYLLMEALVTALGLPAPGSTVSSGTEAVVKFVIPGSS